MRNWKKITSLIVLAGASALVACATRAPARSSAPAVRSAVSHLPAGALGIPSSEYRRVVNDGQPRFCGRIPEQQDLAGGTHIPGPEICLTQAQVDLVDRYQQRWFDFGVCPSCKWGVP